MKPSLCSVMAHSPSPSPSTASLPPNFNPNATTTTTHTPIPTTLHFSRRNLSQLLTIVPFFSIPQPALAFDIGISGPKNWLKDQKKKAIKYILAPIDASRDILSFALQSLLAEKSEYQESDLEDLKGMVRSAARDCVPEERNSIVAFQSKTGVEVCTFKLLVKNASSLLDDNDPAKMEAEAMLDDLIRSFTLLNGVIQETNIQLVLDREKITGALKETLSSIDKFEFSIKGCIDA